MTLRKDLPPQVARFLQRSLPLELQSPHSVRITQRGRMWLKPRGRSLRFEASGSFEIARVAFSWQARFSFAGPLALSVVDEYVDGAGRLEAPLLGLPVQRQSGREVTRGEVLRYLAELPWAPYAMGRNPELEWRELDADAVEVAAHVGRDHLAVRFDFEGASIVRASSEMRALRERGEWVQRPWTGEYSSYEILGGMRLPCEAEVSWELASGRFVYWHGRVISAELLEEPFAP
jgi:hypothetical protein